MKIRTSSLRASSVAAMVVGCGGAADDMVFCTLELRPSVVIQVTDASDSALPDANVSYRVDGGPLQAATCIGPSGGCSSFHAGQEVSGDFSITAAAAGLRSASAAVTVHRDACHVITREIVMTLEPE